MCVPHTQRFLATEATPALLAAVWLFFRMRAFVISEFGLVVELLFTMATNECIDYTVVSYEVLLI